MLVNLKLCSQIVHTLAEIKVIFEELENRKCIKDIFNFNEI